MKNLFNNNDIESSAFEKFERIFDRFEGVDVLKKTAELYLSFLEEKNIELDLAHIVELSEEYGHDLNENLLQCEINHIK